MFGNKKERWIVIGLGNPGSEYERTRHNVGAMVISTLVARHNLKLSTHKSRAYVAEYKLGEKSIVAATLRCYMNGSGGPTKSLMDFYKVKSDNLIVIHDELDIPFSATRLKLGGGDNGHNGLKSITAVMGANYYRLRMGIGRPIGKQDPADFVLKPFSAGERSDLPGFLELGADAIESLVQDGLELAQQSFNK
ncbi:MAG: putative peptidyl-tRNA hydrolase [Actinomycetota bacterium]|jgi:PTH1 family peptidyl-tRNA hydrolase